MLKKLHILFYFLLNYITFYAQDFKLGLPLGHTGYLNSAVFSPDGSLILTSSVDKTARIWEASSGKLLNTLEGYLSYVNSAVFSPDGSKILTASNDNNALTWDTKSGKQLNTLEGHTSYLNSAVFSPDGSLILTSSNDNTARIWETNTGKLLIILEGHTSYLNSAVFSPDGSLILTSSNDNTARIWEKYSGKLLLTLEGHTSALSSAVFSPDGSRILTSSNDSTARIWETNTGKLLLTLEGHTRDVCSAVFSPDGSRILTASMDKTACIWDAISGKQLNILEGHSNYVNSAVFSPDGSRILTASWSYDTKARIWETNSGKLLFTLEGHTNGCRSAQFSPNGSKILTASEENAAFMWEASSGKKLSTLGGHTDDCRASVFSPDGSRILTASLDNTARIFDTKSGKLLITLEGHVSGVKSNVISPDGTRIVSANWDRTASVWEIASGNILTTLEEHAGEVNSAVFSSDGSRIYMATDSAAVFSPDGSRIIAGSFWNTSILEASSGEQLYTLEGRSGGVSSAVFSPNGTQILSASNDSAVRIWEASSGMLLNTLELPSSISSAIFSPSGSQILALSMDTMYILEKSSGKKLNSLAVPGKINYVVFSPDGSQILTILDQKSIHLWEAFTGKLLFILEGHTAEVHSSVFNSKGSRIVSASLDGSIIIWDAVTGKQLIRSFQFDKDPKKWVHLHPSGLFDASPEAMEMMYWTKGMEVIEFSQLKNRYWLPDLWKKVMAGEPLPQVENMQELKLYPLVAVNSKSIEDISIQLTKRDGGYGAVKVFLNGKEINPDARGSNFNPKAEQQKISLNLKNHPYLKNGENEIKVVSSSEAGINSRGVVLTLNNEKEEKKNPQFFAVVIGIGEYANDKINLKFPVQDAEAINKAFSLGAKNLFKERSHVYTLTSKGKTRPNKENIKSVFEDIAKKATSDDIILLYLAGHGVSTSGDNGDFYFLTADAMSASKEAYQDEVIRKSTAISTNEFVDWIKQIPALKQVMILDACGSGKAVDNLIAMRDIEASQIKAIDRMKDRTGMFIISGCAADAVSYEASQYGQGLLTYSLLQAMKGAALEDNKYIDVNTLLGFAREEVPKLANGIGGIQTPQLLVPKSGSFDIGILEDEDKKAIPLANPKTVFVRSNLVDANEDDDLLNLSAMLDDKLAQISARGSDAKIVFFDTRMFPQSCKLSGGYQNKNNKLTIQLKIRCGETVSEYKLEAPSKEELIEKILEIVNAKK
jgi:WD40 repeat protein